jgi:hypothetical protein
VGAQAGAELLDRDVDELGELLDGAAELLELVKNGHLPVFEVAQRRRGGMFDLAALPVEVGKAAVLVGDDVVTGDRDRGELFEQLVFAAPPRLLFGVEPVTGSGQPGKVLPRGGTTTGAPRTLPGRRGRLDHQGWTPHRTTETARS